MSRGNDWCFGWFLAWALCRSTSCKFALVLSCCQFTAGNLDWRPRYNSAIFEVTTGQYYCIHFVNESDSSLVDTLATSNVYLSNSKWESLYDSQFVPDSGDIYLVIDQFALGASLDLSSENKTWSYIFSPKVNGSAISFIQGPTGGPNNTATSVNVSVVLDATGMGY
jgi:hypothetical protein